MLDYRIAEPSDAALFDRVAEGVFDHPIESDLLSKFLTDPRHHIAVADDDGLIVGFVSAVDYVHPDKPRQLWINEVAVAPSHRGRGVGQRLMQLMIEQGQALGCSEAWVLTDEANDAANALYRAVGGGNPAPQLMYTFAMA